jgi:hypothetical protein
MFVTTKFHYSEGGKSLLMNEDVVKRKENLSYPAVTI